MNTRRDVLDCLNQRLQNLPVPRVAWPSDNGRTLSVGQVWTVAGGCGDQPTWLWLVLECLDDGVVSAVPLFRWSELAGPDDVYVPAEWAGTTLIASFELEHTLDRTALGQCQGRLPDAAMRYIADVYGDSIDPVRRQGHTWGLDYLDAVDRRLAYHDAIGTAIEALQASVRAKVFGAAKPLAFLE